jgi:hypothetical protein
MSGVVPTNYSGKLPLEVMATGTNFETDCKIIGGEDLITNNKLVAISKPVGMKFYYIPEVSNWDAKPLFVQQELVSIKYIGYTSIHCPFSLKAEGYLTVPETGKYKFMMSPYIYGRIYIDNKLIFSNFLNVNMPEKNEEMFLNKDKKYKLRVDYKYYCTDLRMKVFCVYVQGPSDKKEKIMPIDWVSPY